MPKIPKRKAPENVPRTSGKATRPDTLPEDRKPVAAKLGVENRTIACRACEGSGDSTAGWPCVPCRGTGRVILREDEWACPYCGAVHRGFKRKICRNENCRRK